MPRTVGRWIGKIKFYGVIFAVISIAAIALFLLITKPPVRGAAAGHARERPPGSKKEQISAPVRFSSVAEAQEEAVRRHPDLSVSGSKLNVAFVTRYKRYQRDRPDYFSDNSWPVRLADEIDARGNQK